MTSDVPPNPPSCPQCGTALDRGARYCPQCGRKVDGSTRVLELPPDETGPVPMEITQVEPRLYGVTPASLLLVLATVAVTLAIVLFATGHWPVGLILLGASILLALLLLERARRRPVGSVSRITAEAVDSFRERAGVAAEAVAMRGLAATRVLALRRDLQRLAGFRGRLLLELGEAVYRGDEQATEEARRQVEELDRLAAQKEAEMQAVVEEAQRRIGRRVLEVQPTEVAEQQPEPTPAPGEGNPPEPARIPEPYPPPDEGTPPQPAIIPEPGPAVIPEPGPQSEPGGG